MISKTKASTLLLVLISVVYTHGQNRTKLIGIETGGEFIGCQSVDKDYIRGEMPEFSADGFSNSIQSQMHRVYGGVKMEVRSLNDKFGLITGVRFIQLNSSISKSASPGYFYLLSNQNSTTTEYLRVKKLSQTASSIGVPVELRYFPLKKIRLFRLYFLIGGEVSYQVTQKTSVTFQDPAMETYQNNVINIIGTPQKLNAMIYGGAGFRIGKEGKPGLNIGVTAPAIISTHSSKLTTPVAGGGIHIQFQIPL